MRAPSGAPSRDLRAPALALVAWAACLCAFLLSGVVVGCLVGVGAVAVGVRGRRGRSWRLPLVWLATFAGIATATTLRIDAVRESPLPGLAEDRATVDALVVTTSDPGVRRGPYGDVVVVRGNVLALAGRGRAYRMRAPVLLVGDSGLGGVRLGSRLRVAGRLGPARGDDLAGVLSVRGPPRVVRGPGSLLAGAEGLRAAIRAAVRTQPVAPRALVPALVDGDDDALPEEVVEDFRTAGLTHLTAVSGTNLTLVVGFVLLLARWAGVRGRGLVLVGALGVVGFVLLARAEPSVVRAAAMGSVALLGMGAHGRHRGTRALGAAVFCLLAFDPWLARSIGFALSAVATAGILWLAPGWRDALQRWCPRWVAEAVSVPLAAQIACTPLVAAISGQVSLVAVGANLLVAPAVGPATVLGLLGGIMGLLSDLVGRALATPAAWSAGWIIAVARRSADLPVAAATWPTTALALALLTGACVAGALVLGPVLRRPLPAGLLGLLLMVAALVPVPTPGWPPAGWVLVACDVGQGDGLVLHAGDGTAVVVDAGPDPVPMERCLDRLGVTRVPLVLLTHFHADHVDGLPGVLAGRRVGVVEVTGWADPPSGVRLVRAAASRAGVRLRPAAYGRLRRVGALEWQVVAPSADPPATSASPPNDSSVVLLVRTRGIRLLLLGDEEEPSQQRLLAETGGIPADVLKVAHHGSANQDEDLIRSTGARLAVVSVGADNDYGHPAPSLMALLRALRMTVARTDRDGDVAVVVRDGLHLVVRGGSGR